MALHLLVFGKLFKQDIYKSKIIYVLLYLAGASYFLVSGAYTVLPGQADMIKIFENILSLPMAVGELTLATWLILRGGKNENK